MKYIVQYILKLLAGKLLKKHSPKIIGITGSVGKTTTKDLIFHVLDSEKSLKVLRNVGNLNNEFGLPLTILEEKPVKGVLNWISLVFRSILKVLKSKEYYDVLVLEMAADGPGDLAYLTMIARPDISVVTNVEKVHLLHFKSLDELAYEKSTLVRAVRKDGMVIVNYDNVFTRSMARIRSDASVFNFGIDKECDIQAKDVVNTKKGLNFKVLYKGKEVDIKMPHVIGKHNIYTVLPVFPIAEYFGLELKDIEESISTFALPPGRMNLKEGLNETFLIDSTYNAEPSSMRAAIYTLRDFPEGKRRIAVIGDMLELGPLEEISHREIGKILKEARIDLIFFVGARMKWAKDEMEQGVSDFRRISFHFNDSFEASKEISQKVKKDDVILVKGSRAMMMERVVYRLSK